LAIWRLNANTGAIDEGMAGKMANVKIVLTPGQGRGDEAHNRAICLHILNIKCFTPCMLT
jgi:hypothetical protein